MLPICRFGLSQLIPGNYRVTFKTAAGATRTVTALVLLDQATVLHLELDATAGGGIEELVVVGQRMAVRG